MMKRAWMGAHGIYGQRACQYPCPPTWLPAPCPAGAAQWLQRDLDSLSGLLVRFPF